MHLGGITSTPFLNLQYRILRAICPQDPHVMETATAYAGKSKLQVLLGDALIDDLRNKVVADFGCGEGIEALEIAHSGARHVIGIDIREDALQRARQRANEAGVKNISFQTSLNEPIDAVVALDSFEHFSEPAQMLDIMYQMLPPGGFVAGSFGPTWYHPLGGHLFSFFPWAHLVFSETALCRWRSHFRSDGARRFSEVEGGLNKMTIRRFQRLVAASPFVAERIEAVPIRRLRHIHNSLTREFTSAIVRCKLRKP